MRRLNLKKTNFILTEDVVANLEELAAAAEMNKSVFLRQMIKQQFVEHCRKEREAAAA